MPRKKKRKSPYRHKVREHKRKGRPVRSYVRGKGEKPHKDRAYLVGESKYSVKVVYPDHTSEYVQVPPIGRAKLPFAFRKALDVGIELRRYIKQPVIVSVRRGPGI